MVTERYDPSIDYSQVYARRFLADERDINYGASALMPIEIRIVDGLYGFTRPPVSYQEIADEVGKSVWRVIRVNNMFRRLITLKRARGYAIIESVTIE